MAIVAQLIVYGAGETGALAKEVVEQEHRAEVSLLPNEAVAMERHVLLTAARHVHAVEGKDLIQLIHREEALVPRRWYLTCFVVPC